MKYHHVAYMILALMISHAVVTEGRAAPDKVSDAVGTAESDLTGYWRQGDGQIFYFSQDGNSLTSWRSDRSANNHDHDIDFTATIHGNLVYGAHRGPFSRAMEAKCSRQIWVGMGLTLNDARNQLTGFRGDRIVESGKCITRNADPVGLVYTRVADAGDRRPK